MEDTKPMTYAYLRVSTDDKGQTTDNQRKTIVDLGFKVDEWYSEDGVSGKVDALDRPIFKALMEKAVAGSEVVTVSLDRIGRNAIDILQTVERFKEKKIKLRCLQIGDVDLTSMAGQILIHMMSLMADLERQMISIRTKAGLERTKAQGTLLGRKMKVSADVLEKCIEGRLQKRTWAELATEHSVDKNTLLQTVAKWEGDVEGYKVRWEKQKAQESSKLVSKELDDEGYLEA